VHRSAPYVAHPPNWVFKVNDFFNLTTEVTK